MKKLIAFYMGLFVNGFLFMLLAGANYDWFYSFGWLIGALWIALYLAVFPVPGLHRWVGLFLQMFALFIPIKLLLEFHQNGIFTVARLENLSPILVLGQLFLVMGVFALMFITLFFIISKRFNLYQKLSSDY
ncbi:MAG: hypothetical protein LRY73_19845 [Bacillus sp. (in: Bacteria)]|nr:hypothetical protein [Bacillus sp. (in: firmicutes)]